MKLWNTDNSIDKRIERFTIGQDNVLDMELAKYDVIGSKAHATMLASAGIINQEELASLSNELDEILSNINKGEFEIEPGVEDIHSQIEKILVEKVGDAGKKIHTARSRNDQVLLDLRLYFREELKMILEDLWRLIMSFSKRSDDTKDKLMPGFTHMQVGMVSSYGMWFGCFAEALIDDYNHLNYTRKLINQNPLGSAAGYGSSFNIDRKQTTELLGFDNLCYNSMFAQFGRGKTELLVVQSISNVAFTISKFAYDICLYSNQNYNLVKLPDEFTTGSSIMPHKKNPDVFELIRSRCNQLQGLPNQVLMIIQNLPSGYHRDFQQIKEIVFPAFAVIKDVIEMLTYVLPLIKINQSALTDKKYDTLYSVDNMNALIQDGISLRDAYFQIKTDLANNSFVPLKDLDHKHVGSLGNLCNEEILNKIDNHTE